MRKAQAACHGRAEIGTRENEPMNPIAHIVDWSLRRFENSVTTPQGVLNAAAGLRPTVDRGWLSRDVVRDVQLLRIKRAVRYAYERSPFYRTQFDTQRIHPADIRTLDDVAKLPFTTSTDLRDWRKFLCVPESELAAVFTTSGTTGEPKRVYYTWREMNALANLGAVALRVRHAGRMVALIALPQGLWMGSSEAQRVVERAGGLPLSVGAGDPQEVVKGMRRFMPNVVISSPSYMTALTREAERAGFKIPLKLILLGGELLTDAHTARFHDYWGAQVYNTYGSTEIGGGQTIALPDCACLHLNDLHLFTEIVDPVTGKPSNEGELVFTTLTREAMPLVRYRMGDHARWSGCHCYLPFGSILLGGRTDDMVVAGDMNLYGQVIADALATIAGATGRVRLEFDKVELTDRLRVRIEGGQVNVDEARARMFETYPELRENTANGNLILEIETGANLDGQIKSVKILDRRVR